MDSGKTYSSGTLTADRNGGGAPPRSRSAQRGLMVALAILLAAGAFGFFRWQEARSRHIAGLHAARAVELRESGDLTGALRELERASRVDPRNGHAWYLLAKTREEQKPGTGLADYARATKYAPQNAALLRDYGQALHQADRIDEARALLVRAVELAPTDQAAHAALGRAYVARVTHPDDLKKGVAALRTALDLQPGDVQTRYRLARALHQSEELDRARAEFETTLSLLAEGALAGGGRMDGRAMESVAWISIVKGCHHHLAQIAARQKRSADRVRHQQTFDEMNRYIRGVHPLFTRLDQDPQDAGAQRQLRALYATFGFPPAGPDAKAAVARWVRK